MQHSDELTHNKSDILFFTYEKHPPEESPQSQQPRNKVQKTIDGYDDYGREAFSAAVRYLASTPRLQWDRPHARKLKNVGSGQVEIYEIRYKANNKQTRALGFFRNQDTEFVITLICTHKETVYDPPGAFDSAVKNAKAIQDGTANAVPLKIFGETFPPNEG